MSVPTPADVLRVARAEVGYREGRSNGHWNNHEKYAAAVPGLAWVDAQEQPWCATFVAWVALKAGAGDLYPRTASTDAGAAWFKQRGQWSEAPVAPGDQVFYGHHGDMSHTGILESFDATHITVIEGNTNTNGSAEGDGVHRMVRLRRDEFVQGYGHPKWPATPKQKTRPAPVRAAIKAVKAAITKATGPVQKRREQNALDDLKQIKKR
jgi:hypothetical protein